MQRTSKKIDYQKRFVGFRLLKHDLERLDKLAEQEERSRSAMIRRLLKTAMTEA